MILYDAVTPSNIPPSAKLVGGYTDGLYKWSQEHWDLFPNAYHLRISVFSTTNDGEVLDVENGDATPDLAPGWVAMRRFAGIDPTVYCNSSTWPSVIEAFIKHNIAPPHYWIANYSNGPHIPPGAVAVQYAKDVNPGYDLSITNDQWPISTPVAPVIITSAPTSTKVTGENMNVHLITVALDTAGNGSVILDGNTNSTPGVTSSSLSIPWENYVAIAGQGSDPAADGTYWASAPHIQNRNGFVLVTVTGGIPKGAAGVYVTATV